MRKRLLGVLLLMACPLTIAQSGSKPTGSSGSTAMNQTNTTQTIEERTAVKKAVQQGLGQSPLFKINKVAVASDYALVSWLQGEAGGVALLNKKSGGWKILTNSGGWLGLGDLKKFGVPQTVAELLLTQIDPKWRNYE